MKTTDILLVVNSILLGLVGLLFGLIGYLLKDLHRDFKNMFERVNKLHSELTSHVKVFENLSRLFQRQIDNLYDRVKKIEKRLFQSTNDKKPE